MTTSLTQGPAQSAFSAAGRLFPLAGFVIIALVLTLPILAHPYLPLVDLPNHIARHYVAVSQGGPLAQYYSYHLSLVPNSAADIAYILFGDPADPIGFSRVVMAVYAVGLVGAAMILSRVVWGRWSAWPLATALVVYNGNFFWGFQNFLLTMPFAIAGLALWLGTEGRSIWQRLALLAPLAAFLFLLHLFAFAFLAIAAFGREMQRLLAASGRRGAQLREGILLGLCFVPPGAWLVTDILTSPPPIFGTITAMGDWSHRLLAFGSVTAGPTVASVPMMDHLGTFVLVLLITLYTFFFSRKGPRLVLASPLTGPVAAVAVASVLAPVALNGVFLTHIRFPFVLCAILIAGSRWDGLPQRMAAFLGLVVLSLVSARGVAFERSAAVHSAEMQDLSAVLDTLPRGGRLLALHEGPALEHRLWHVAAYAVSQREAFVPTLFQGAHSLVVLPEWRSSSHPQETILPIALALKPDAGPLEYPGVPPVEFLQNWRQKFTHLLIVSESGIPATIPSEITFVSQVNRFVLYSVAPGRS